MIVDKSAILKAKVKNIEGQLKKIFNEEGRFNKYQGDEMNKIFYGFDPKAWRKGFKYGNVNFCSAQCYVVPFRTLLSHRDKGTDKKHPFQAI